MSTNQLFLALLATILTALGAFYKVLKDYMDSRFGGVDRHFTSILEARFNGMDRHFTSILEAQSNGMTARFNSIDKKLDFLVEHFVDHESRISIVEERTKNQ